MIEPHEPGPPAPVSLSPDPGRAPAGPPAPADVTIIIVAYETPALLARCLDSLETDGLLGRLPVMVIDNSRNDACARVVGSWSGRVDLVRNPRNVGYARAVNQGIERAQTPFVLILNPDIVVRPGAVARLRRAMDEAPQAGITAACLLNPDGTLQHSARRFYTAGTLLLRRTFLGRLFPDHRLMREHLMTDWDHASVRDVDWVLGACLMVRRAAIEDVGPMDERFFLYFEDVDWCARMHNHGWQVLYIPDAVMDHDHRRESAEGSTLGRSARFHLSSMLRFYEKWSLFLYLLKRNLSGLRGAVLLVADLAALTVAFLGAFGTRKLLSPWFHKPLFPLADYWQFLLVFGLASVLAFRAFGLYRASRPTAAFELSLRVIPAVLIASLAPMVAIFFLYMRATSRIVVGLNLPLAVIAVVGMRLALGRVWAGLAERGLATRRVLLVGDPELATWTRARLARGRTPRYEIVGTIEAASPLLATGDVATRLRDRCVAERASELWIADRDGKLLGLTRDWGRLETTGIGLRLVGPFSRELGASVALDRVGGVTVLTPVDTPGGPRGSAVKRWTEGLVAALLLLPIGLAVGWIRCLVLLGAGSMTPETRHGWTGAGERVPVPSYRGSGVAAGAERLFALAEDLRAVLGGRLALVGVSRHPELPLEPDRTVRAARPGLLTPSHPTDAPAQRLESDRSYVLNWSLEKDLQLLLVALRSSKR